MDFGNVQRQLQKAKDRFKLLQDCDSMGLRRDDLHVAREEVHKWLEREEIMRRQRAKTLWLREEDHNSKFFHTKVNHRQKEFNWKVTATAHRGNCDFFGCLAGRVTDEMNVDLIKPYTEAKVFAALKQMEPASAPGPDGMAPLFFQNYWPILGKSVSIAILEVLNFGIIPSSMNHTFISLIPKKKNPVKVADFRPISLCNVIYKLISKVIANRLKKVLPCIISDSQCAFVPSRLITDNVLVAYELVHFLKMKRTDDSIIFCKADVGENIKIQALLKKYEHVSGQKINTEKTAMIFSGNVSRDSQEELRQLWGVSEVQNYGKYLDLPPVIG
ncbi:uncharacterized protein LOC121264798 [Juglans microcarpa x Juglans regia]|uniref:uncharacterized protein LOC121264798 n=1 Tax=Juglans microcarpa x Juglans regia TaxID=2249226 RepID=UPI001B7EF63F|nr:uncharacterized protein LOC121264798 [Juglans microcarpa x Juglans regia]